MPSRRLLFGLPTPSRSPTLQTSSKSDNTISTKPVPADRRGSITMDHILKIGKNKRHSLTERQLSGGKAGPSKPASLEIDVKSPPLVFYGPTQTSTGALLGGELHLNVTEPDLKLQRFSMQLLAKVSTKKPVTKDCPDCRSKTHEIFKWNFISEPTKYTKDKHTIPFSYLLPGHLTASHSGKLGSIEYWLEVAAIYGETQTISSTRSLEVKRALQPPAEDRTSDRVFPPTNLRSALTHPPVIYPMGEFTCVFRLTGLFQNKDNGHYRYTLRRLMWRIEEISEIISPACPKHANKVGGEGKGVTHDNTRTIGEKELNAGWKTDWSHGGTIELEFIPSLTPSTHPTCDLENPTGLKVKHRIGLELVVIEEMEHSKRPNHWVATGAARVLRMQHNVVITERSGMGISWDEEQPPMYEDVPESPPGYIAMDDYTGTDLSGPVSRLDLGESIGESSSTAANRAAES